MPEWLWILIIGGVVMGLVGTVYTLILSKINGLAKWREGMPRTEEILTKLAHSDICRENNKYLTDFLDNQQTNMKAYFDMKIENVILKEIRTINSKK